MTDPPGTESEMIGGRVSRSYSPLRHWCFRKPVGYTLFRSFLAGLGLLLFGLVMAAIYFFLARFFREASLILADIGDSIVEANSRQAVASQGVPQAF